MHSPFDESLAKTLAAMGAGSEPAVDEGVPPPEAVAAAQQHELQQQEARAQARATPRWVPSGETSACMLCRAEFSKLRTPRHHCRRCGWAVCGPCSTQMLGLDRWLEAEKPHTVRHLPSSELLRVCDSCHSHSLEGRADAARRSSVGQGDAEDRRLRRAFEVIDLDNSGCISWVELSFALRGGFESTAASAGSEQGTHGGFSNTELDDLLGRAQAVSDSRRLFLADFLALCEADPAMGVILTNAASLAQAQPDPWATMAVQDCPTRAAVRKSLAVDDSRELGMTVWEEEEATVKLDTQPFAKGAMRLCFRCLLQLPSGVWRRMVAKQYLEAPGGDETPEGALDGAARECDAEASRRLEEDARMQSGAKAYAQQYNECAPRGAKRIDFLQSFLLEIPTGTPGLMGNLLGGPKLVFYLEAFVQGQYVKHSSNHGFVGSVIEANVEGGGNGGELGYLRWTPHAFSHFTFEASGGRELVVDIQGVEDLYTDPAVHSFSSQGFGSGNSGPEGMLNFFLTHRCSPLCQSMGLLPFLCTDQELNSGTELGTASDAADTAATAGEGGSSPKTGVIRNRGARSGGGRGVLGSEVEAEALSRVGSGATLVESHELYVRRSIHVAADTRADLVESMGRLHAKLALHYMPKRYSYTTGREEGDALAEAVARLRRSGKLMEASLFHVAAAAAFLRRRMPVMRRQLWVGGELAAGARHAESSLQHFDYLVREYDKTEDILELRQKWVALEDLLSECSSDGGSGAPTSTGLSVQLCGVSASYLKLVGRRDVLLQARGPGQGPAAPPPPAPSGICCKQKPRARLWPDRLVKIEGVSLNFYGSEGDDKPRGSSIVDVTDCAVNVGMHKDFYLITLLRKGHASLKDLDDDGESRFYFKKAGERDRFASALRNIVEGRDWNAVGTEPQPQPQAEPEAEPELEPQPEPEPEPEQSQPLVARSIEPETDSEASDLSSVQLELLAADDIATALLIWSGEDASILPEETERLKYPTLVCLAVVAEILEFRPEESAQEKTTSEGDQGASLAGRLRAAEEAVGAELDAWA